MLGMIGAMDEEVNAILEILENKNILEYYGMKFWEGNINKIKCVVGQSGIGKVNAARCTQIMIDKFEILKIINIGSAGALNPKLEIGDVVISSSCIHHDADITAFGHPKGYIPGFGDRFIKADDSLIKICTEVMNKVTNTDYKIMIGPVATGDQFHNSLTAKAELWKEFEAYCVDMEAAAIAQVCYLCNIPFIVIRSISDNASHQAEISFYEFLKLASARCAEFIDKLTKYLEEYNK